MSAASLTALIARCRVLCQRQAHLSDAELLLRFGQQRDSTAFEQLLERYAALVWGVCRRILPVESDREDAFQATFLALVRRPDAINPGQSLGAWLHTVAVRVALKAQARARRQRPQAMLPERITSGDVADEVSSRELFRIVDEEIERLPEALRAPLILCCLQGQTRDEAAAALGCSVGTVKGRLERGRDLLRRRLERRGVQLPVALLALTLTSERIHAALWTKTMQAALYAPAPTVAALAEAALPVLTAGKCKAALAILLMMTMAVGAVGTLQTAKPVEKSSGDTPPQAKAAAPKKSEAPQVRRDRHGDPLPEGAIARLGTVRWRHGFFAQGLAYSPDGKMIAAVGAGRAVTLWDAATGKEIHHFPNLSDHPDSVAFSSNGKILATGGFPCRLWDVAAGKELRQIGNGRVALAPDGKRLATVAHDGKLRLWDVSAGKELWRSESGLDRLVGVAYASDGKRIAFCGLDGDIHLRDADTGKRLHRLTGHGKGVWCITFSPDGKRLASSSEDESIRLWDTATGRQVRVLGDKLGVSSIMPVAFSPDGAFLASGHIGGIIRLWDAATGEEKRRWRTGSKAVHALAFSPDGKTVVSSAPWESSIRLWDTATGRERHPSEEHFGFIELVRFSPDGAGLVSISRDSRILWWDLATQTLRRRFSWNAKGFSPIALSPDGNTLAASDWSTHEFGLWDVRTGKFVSLLGDAKKRIKPLAFSPDGRLLASSMGDEGIHIWDVRDRKMLRQIKTVSNGMTSLCFSPDSKSLAYGTWTRDHRSLRMWEVESGQEKVTFPCFDRFVGPLAFSPNGKVLAAGSNNSNAAGASSVRLWDTATGQERSAHTGHGDLVGAIAFSADGKLVASGAGSAGYLDNSVHVWEAATGRLIRRFEGHHSCVTSVDFAPDGLSVASGAGDSTILLWDITGRRSDGHWHAKPLSPKQLDACWMALANEDAAKAYEVVWMLVAAPEQAAPFLRKHLPPILPPDAKAVARLIADLDSAAFPVRQRATDELSKLGDAVAPALQQALEGKPALEMRRRLQQLLDQTCDWTAERLRDHRAIQALEQMNTRSARETLQALAGGAPQAERTEEAKAASRRLAR